MAHVLGGVIVTFAAFYLTHRALSNLVRRTR